MWVAAKAVLRGEFTAQNTHIRKGKSFKINNVSFHLKKLGKNEQIKTQSRRKKIKNGKQSNEK